jgi:pSer/pThr/pTyr-binding forkhead associated (FHA) protein
VERVVLRALAKDPKKRFQTAGGLAAALEEAAIIRKAEPAVQRGEPSLQLVTGEGRRVLLTGVVGIGRHSDNQVQIPDPQVSRQHAQIRCQGVRCQIQDLGSRNGTFVNGKRLEPNIPHLLQQNDQIRLGSTVTFLVEMASAVAEPPKKPTAIQGRGPTPVPKTKNGGRSHVTLLLAGGIALLLALLCLATWLALTGGSLGPFSQGANSASQFGDRTIESVPGGSADEMAALLVVNATDQHLAFVIEATRIELDAGEGKAIWVAPGEYEYTVILESGEQRHEHGSWHAGDNGQLQLVTGGP